MSERIADYPIDSVFIDRWSPRAFSGEPITESELFSLFEAARWAPSAFNSQPWRFVYARRDTPEWDKLLAVLVEFNRSWVQHAAALVFVVSKTMMTPPGKDQEVPSYSHSFDAGGAWVSLALQATKSGWATHGMVGIVFEAAPVALALPEGYRVEAAIAIGKQGNKSILPEMLQAREMPSPRMKVSEFAFEGVFKV